jgi:hypothetical protein
MFSSIRLGRSELNLYDIYRLRLSSDLVTPEWMRYGIERSGRGR